MKRKVIEIERKRERGCLDKRMLRMRDLRRDCESVEYQLVVSERDRERQRKKAFLGLEFWCGFTEVEEVK